MRLFPHWRTAGSAIFLSTTILDQLNVAIILAASLLSSCARDRLENFWTTLELKPGEQPLQADAESTKASRACLINNLYMLNH